MAHSPGGEGQTTRSLAVAMPRPPKNRAGPPWQTVSAAARDAGGHFGPIHRVQCWCLLTTELIEDEIATTKPLSVTLGEQVQALRQWAHGRTVSAD